MKLSGINHPIQILIYILDYYAIYYNFFCQPPHVTF